ncbi:ion transporter [Alteromonadaceae bacterium M269]|nr:ion transporter [Alteromonadaceae bacterium M269]
MFKIDRAKLKESHEGIWLLIDFLMLGLLLLNLLFIIFDSLYETSFFIRVLDWLSPSIATHYQPVHDNFIFIDLGFITVFLTEFCVRWIVAIKRKTYLRWYFFPFLHWYDLVGCIPLSGTRIFRFLRIFSILYRLHKYQIIDFRQSGIIRFLSFYYDVFIEELSDRIVVKVLSDAQKEISVGSPLIEDVVTQVLKPRQTVVNEWLSNILRHVGDSINDTDKGAIIREHVKRSVGLAVRENSQVSTLNLVPVVGSTIESVLESAVSDIVIQSIVHLLKDMTPEKIDNLVQHAVQAVPSGDNDINQEIITVVNESIEILKAHVSEQRWKSQLS